MLTDTYVQIEEMDMTQYRYNNKANLKKVGMDIARIRQLIYMNFIATHVYRYMYIYV